MFARILSIVLIAAIGAYAWWLNGADQDAYMRAVQEDEYIEWASFWAFIAAFGAYLVASRRQLQVAGQIPWFQVGVALFCLVVALEEISWGQRIFAYQPPVYFLENNFQLELNVHNVVAKEWRIFSLKAIMLLYGFLLPVLSLEPRLGRILDKLAIVAPAPLFMIVFVGNAWFYNDYTLKFTGEFTELMLGLSFLFVAIDYIMSNPLTPEKQEGENSLLFSHSLLVVFLWLVIIGLGFGTTWSSQKLRSVNEELTSAAKVETSALAADIWRLIEHNGSRKITQCSIHRRIRGHVEAFNLLPLYRMNFGRLTEQGMSEVRRDYFLDPWNSPYWFQHRCTEDRSVVTVMVYSFGPDRKRDTSEHEIGGDDIGTIIYSKRPKEKAAD